MCKLHKIFQLLHRYYNISINNDRKSTIYRNLIDVNLMIYWFFTNKALKR